MNIQQLILVWEDIKNQMDEGSLGDDEGHDKFSDILSSQGMDYNDFCELADQV